MASDVGEEELFTVNVRGDKAEECEVEEGEEEAFRGDKKVRITRKRRKS